MKFLVQITTTATRTREICKLVIGDLTLAILTKMCELNKPGRLEVFPRPEFEHTIGGNLRKC